MHLGKIYLSRIRIEYTCSTIWNMKYTLKKSLLKNTLGKNEFIWDQDRIHMFHNLKPVSLTCVPLSLPGHWALGYWAPRDLIFFQNKEHFHHKYKHKYTNTLGANETWYSSKIFFYKESKVFTDPRAPAYWQLLMCTIIGDVWDQDIWRKKHIGGIRFWRQKQQQAVKIHTLENVCSLVETKLEIKFLGLKIKTNTSQFGLRTCLNFWCFSAPKIFDKYQVWGAEEQTSRANLAHSSLCFFAPKIFDKYQVWGPEHQS